MLVTPKNLARASKGLKELIQFHFTENQPLKHEDILDIVEYWKETTFIGADNLIELECMKDMIRLIETGHSNRTPLGLLPFYLNTEEEDMEVGIFDFSNMQIPTCFEKFGQKKVEQVTKELTERLRAVTGKDDATLEGVAKMIPVKCTYDIRYMLEAMYVFNYGELFDN